MCLKTQNSTSGIQIMVGVAMPLTIIATINVTPAGKIQQIQQKRGGEIDWLI